MIYRDNWKFEYSIADLKAAALTKEAWHASRLEFWLNKSDLQVDLNAYQNKIHEHKQKLTDYQTWVFIFDSQSQTNILELSKDDYLYFYSK